MASEDETHDWIGAATVPVDDRTAGTAHRRGTMRLPTTQDVEILEIYCKNCRRTYRDVKGQSCVMGVHLIGGHADGSRRKRGPQSGVLATA